MPEMDTTDTDFDPTLDEPRWNVVVDTPTKQYSFKNVGREQRGLLFKLTMHNDYDYSTGEGCHEYINGKVVEHVDITAALTKREQEEQEEMWQSVLRDGGW